MKRNMDLIRILLLHLEAHNHLGGIEDYSPQELAYHVSLLEEAGLITQAMYLNIYLADSILDGIRITWAGHEFIESSRNKSLWERAKQVALDKTGSLSFEVIKTVLIQLSKDAISNSTT